MSAATMNEMERLRRERDEAFAKGKQVFEDLRRAEAERDALAKELKRCMSFLHCHFPSSDKDAAYNEAKKCLEAVPTNSSARRDARMKAEGAAELAHRLRYDYEGEIHQDRIADFADDVASDLHRKTEKGK